MLSLLRTLLSRTGQDRGFTLIELLIVVLIVGILAAVGTPIYLGYVRDAKSAEGKQQAGALWTAMQTVALSQCGIDTPPSAGYSKAGFTVGNQTADLRWTVSNQSSLNINCTTGVYTASGTVFELDGTAADVSGIKIQLTYSTGGLPPSQLKCDLLSTGTFSPC
jgi:type IV pilus assembly protein PilA